MFMRLLSGLCAMREYTERYHVLEISERGQIWHAAEAGMYREAFVLAHHGRISEAIELAETTRIKEYGDMHNTDFRVVTKTRTVTANGAMTEFRMAR